MWSRSYPLDFVVAWGIVTELTVYNPLYIFLILLLSGASLRGLEY